MPESPEVETIKRGLGRRILNKKIKSIWLEPSFKKKISPSAERFIDFLVGKQFIKIERRAKMLILTVQDGKFLLVHLKLTGQFIFQSAPYPSEGEQTRFARVVFTFDDSARLIFNDMRKFGYMKLVDAAGLETELRKYGVEPLGKKFTLTVFNGIIDKRKNRAIKNVLMEQALIAGIGNIYSDEICFFAGVRPKRLVRTLSNEERKKSFAQIRRILLAAIKHRGSSVDNYVASDGRQGDFQKLLRVYGRGGEVCLKCKKTKIVRLKINGRSSCYCPRCQK